MNSSYCLHIIPWCLWCFHGLHEGILFFQCVEKVRRGTWTGSEWQWCPQTWHSPVTVNGKLTGQSVDERQENQCVIKELMSPSWLFLVLFYFPVVAQTSPKWQYWVSLESAAPLWKVSTVLVGFPLYFSSKALNLICCVYKAEPCWDYEQCWFWNLQKEPPSCHKNIPDNQG